MLEHLDKNPLCPFVKCRIRRVDLHIPVTDRADLVDLPADIGNICRRGNGRMLACLNRIVFSRQTESVPAHRMDHIMTAVHHLVPGPDIRNDIASPMSYMKACAGRIRKHVKTIILRLLSVVDVDGMLLPFFSPLVFHFNVVIWNCHNSKPPAIYTRSNNQMQMEFNCYPLCSFIYAALAIP